MADTGMNVLLSCMGLALLAIVTFLIVAAFQ